MLFIHLCPTWHLLMGSQEAKITSCPRGKPRFNRVDQQTPSTTTGDQESRKSWELKENRPPHRRQWPHRKLSGRNQASSSANSGLLTTVYFINLSIFLHFSWYKMSEIELFNNIIVIISLHEFQYHVWYTSVITYI